MACHLKKRHDANFGGFVLVWGVNMLLSHVNGVSVEYVLRGLVSMRSAISFAACAGVAVMLE